MHTILPFILTASFADGTAFGQEAAPPPTETVNVRAISLDEAIAFARAHQPEMRAALSRIGAQKAAADVPRGQWLPTVGVTAQLFGATANNTTGTYVSPGNFMDLPRIGGTGSSLREP